MGPSHNLVQRIILKCIQKRCCAFLVRSANAAAQLVLRTQAERKAASATHSSGCKEVLSNYLCRNQTQLISLLRSSHISLHPTRTKDTYQAGNKQSRSTCKQKSPSKIFPPYILRKVLPMSWIKSAGQNANQCWRKSIT